jgi:hypothetical protein
MPPKYKPVSHVPPIHIFYLLPPIARKEPFEIYRDESHPSRELVQCDLCKAFFVHTGSSSGNLLGKHRGKKGCKDAAAKLEYEREMCLANEALLASGLVAPIALEVADFDALPPSSPPLYFPSSSAGEASESESLNFDLEEPLQPDIYVTEFTELPEKVELEVLGEENNPCKGQPVEWVGGTVWQAYSYGQHENEDMSWKPIGWAGDYVIILRAKRCHGRDSEGKGMRDAEREKQRCKECEALLYSPALQRCMERAMEIRPHTPWRYLNHEQMSLLVVSERRAKRGLQAEVCVPFKHNDHH